MRCEGQLRLVTEGVWEISRGKNMEKAGRGQDRGMLQRRERDLEMDRNWQELTGPEWCVGMHGKR